MSLSSLNSIGQTVFQLESGNGNFDGRTNGQTKGRNYTHFERKLTMMVIYLPVKFEFDWTQRFRVRVRKQKCWRTDKRTKNRQKKGQNYTNFERNLAVMVFYLPVKFEFDWTKHFRVRVRKRKFWQTNGQTNGQNYTNFERNLAMMVIYVPVNFEFDWINRFRVKVPERKMWTDRQTDKRMDGITPISKRT